ncbi:MAG: TusE/DsrC/DsvC family sulfur relay protein [Bacteroidota bacterium]
MAQKEYAGKMIDLNEEGYLINHDQWDIEVAKSIAAEDGLVLTQKHIDVLNYIREKTASGIGLTIRAIGKSGIVDIKEFYQLFPGAPLKKATKIAGVAKPTSCI